MGRLATRRHILVNIVVFARVHCGDDQRDAHQVGHGKRKATSTKNRTKRIRTIANVNEGASTSTTVNESRII